jgi:predicted transcriptional regulator
MEILWNKGEATVSDVVSMLPPGALAYSSVLTTLRILEQKGYLRHRKVGRAFLYQPSMDRMSARSSTLGYVLRRFFDGSPAALVENLVASQGFGSQELAEVRRVVERAHHGSSSATQPQGG